MVNGAWKTQEMVWQLFVESPQEINLRVEVFFIVETAPDRRADKVSK
jgi:hypothetical protein